MDRRYHTSVQILHWLIALIVIGLICLGLILKLDLVPKSLRQTIAFFHIGFGLTVLALTILRLAIRIWLHPPPLPASISAPVRIASAITQALFYLLLLAMPAFGILFVEAHGSAVSWFGLVYIPTVVGKDQAINELFSSMHFWGGMTLIALLVLHVAGVIRHEARGEKILRRMLPRRTRR